MGNVSPIQLMQTQKISQNPYSSSTNKIDMSNVTYNELESLKPPLDPLNRILGCLPMTLVVTPGHTPTPEEMALAKSTPFNLVDKLNVQIQLSSNQSNREHFQQLLDEIKSRDGDKLN